MTAPFGSDSFTTSESKASEDSLKKIICYTLSQKEFSDFTLEKSYSVNELYNSFVATNKNGKDSMTEPDAGLLKYRGEVVGLGDNKYQHSQQNACERVGFYCMDAMKFGLSTKRIFVVFAGDGFEPHNDKGHVGNSTGKMIVRANNFCTLLVNPTEKEIYDKYCEYLRQIIREEQ